MGYKNKSEDEKITNSDCFVFKNSLPSANTTWQNGIEKNADSLRLNIEELCSYAQGRNSQLVLTLARCNLMLADHYYSSLNDKEHEYRKNISEQITCKTELYANTYKKELAQP